MKKLIKTLLSLLLAFSILPVTTTFADYSAGLYVTNNLDNLDDIIEGNYENVDLRADLSNEFSLYFGNGNEYVFLYYDGDGFTNVSNSSDLTFASKDYFDFEKTTTQVGQSQTSVNCVKFSPKKLGTDITDVAISYKVDENTSYSISKFSVTYPDLFIIDKDKEPSSNLSSINTSYDLYLNQEIEVEFYSYSSDKLTKISKDVSIPENNSVTYDNDTNKLKGVKSGSYNFKLVENGPSINFHVSDKTEPTSIPVVLSDSINFDYSKSTFIFEYGNNRYMLGLGNGSSDNSTMHIDGGSKLDLSESNGNNNVGMSEDILIAKIDDDDKVIEPATSDVYGLFNNFSYKIISDNENYTDKIVASYCKKTIFGVETDDISVSISKDLIDIKEKAKILLEFSFEYKQETHILQYIIDIEKPDRVSISFESLYDLNTILSSQTNLINAAGRTVDEDTIVEISLDNDYTGDITICCGNNLHDLIINGNNHTLTGSISSKNSLTCVNNLNFQSNSSNQKALSLINTDNDIDEVGDIKTVNNCTFTGYEYGVYSFGYGLISGISNCIFDDCNTGIYIDCTFNCSYSDSLEDLFIDCDTGIEIKQIPDDVSPYQFVLRDMSFVYDQNDQTKQSSYISDYTIHCKGNFFYIGNFYGKYTTKPDSLEDSLNTAVRTAKVLYKDTTTSETKIYTNPCIRYVDDGDIILGIDNTDGLFTAIFSDDDEYSHINVNDLDTDIDLDICQKGTGNKLAVLSFKEDN